MKLYSVHRKLASGSLMFLLFAIALFGSEARAQDWPQWRGPHRDGVVAGFRAPKKWPGQLKQIWKVAIGEGHSTPVVSAGRVYTIARQGEQEVIAAYNLADGKLLWKDSYPAAYRMNPAATGHGKGPKSTPVIAEGKLCTLGITEVLSCYDLATGKLKWRKEFGSQYKQTSPTFGTAMSPVIDRGLLIAHVGGPGQGALTAFDLNTGAVKWNWADDGPAYASPVIAEFGGVRQAITQSQSNVIGVATTNGALLTWRN